MIKTLDCWRNEPQGEALYTIYAPTLTCGHEL